MPVMRAVIVQSDMITSYGRGTDSCWKGLHSGSSGIRKLGRFRTNSLHSGYASTVGGLTYHEDASLVEQMLIGLFDGKYRPIPDDASLILATTKGEIHLLEKELLDGSSVVSGSNPQRLLEKVSVMSGAMGKGMVSSAACASSSAGLALASSMVQAGRSDCVLTVACDAVTEFVFSGFSSLMALDSVPARPFDKDRGGLTVGEGAAYALVMSEERAAREGYEIEGEVKGWGLSDDANHMTGPSRESEGLILAIKKAMKAADTGISDIALISAHGTGTIYNDAMEMKGFSAVFGGKQIPVYSVKGGVGHTMGAAGLIETLIALRSLKEGKALPTVNLVVPDDCAEGWVSRESRPICSECSALLTNAGFGGINAALVLSRWRGK